MAKKCARTFSIVVEKGKKSILEGGHLLPGPSQCNSRVGGRPEGAEVCVCVSRRAEKFRGFQPILAGSL